LTAYGATLNAERSASLEVERLFYAAAVSYVGRDIFQTRIDCMCGAEVKIGDYREHLVRRHCNVEGCSERALRTVSFGFRDPQFRMIGPPMGICRRHEHYVGKGRMHVIVDPPRS
jgi:hypothetical protein